MLRVYCGSQTINSLMNTTLYLIITVFAVTIGVGSLSVAIQLEITETLITTFSQWWETCNFSETVFNNTKDFIATKQLSLSLLVYSVLLSYFVVYSISVRAKHCYTNVPKFIVDMQIAHVGQKVLTWITMYRFVMLFSVFVFRCYARSGVHFHSISQYLVLKYMIV